MSTERKPLDIQNLIQRAEQLREDIQSAVSENEHIVDTAEGKIETGQLVVAASAAGTVVTNLWNHIEAQKRVLETYGAPAPAANKQ